MSVIAVNNSCGELAWRLFFSSMFNDFRFRFSCVLLLATLISPSAKAGDKHKDSPCDKPREVASPPQLSKEAQVKARKIRAQGYVAIVISEDGDVTDAKVIQASSPEAVDLLLCLLYTSPSPRDYAASRMPSSA